MSSSSHWCQPIPSSASHISKNPRTSCPRCRTNAFPQPTSRFVRAMPPSTIVDSTSVIARAKYSRKNGPHRSTQADQPPGLSKHIDRLMGACKRCASVILTRMLKIRRIQSFEPVPTEWAILMRSCTETTVNSAAS